VQGSFPHLTFGSPVCSVVCDFNSVFSLGGKYSE
jgi:hypothetical protein